jgi:hypothetical protein
MGNVNDRVLVARYLREILDSLGEKQAKLRNGTLSNWLAVYWPGLSMPEFASLVVTLDKKALYFEKRWGKDEYRLNKRNFGAVNLADPDSEKKIKKFIRQTAKHFRRATKTHYLRAVKDERIALGQAETPLAPELAKILAEITGVNP